MAVRLDGVRGSIYGDASSGIGLVGRRLRECGGTMARLRSLVRGMPTSFGETGEKVPRLVRCTEGSAGEFCKLVNGGEGEEFLKFLLNVKSTVTDNMTISGMLRLRKRIGGVGGTLLSAGGTMIDLSGKIDILADGMLSLGGCVSGRLLPGIGGRSYEVSGVRAIVRFRRGGGELLRVTERFDMGTNVAAPLDACVLAGDRLLSLVGSVPVAGSRGGLVSDGIRVIERRDCSVVSVIGRRIVTCIMRLPVCKIVSAPY